MTAQRRDLLLLAAWTALIFWGGGARLPAAPIEPPGIGLDKVGHVVAFFLTHRIATRALAHYLVARSGLGVSLAGAFLAAALGGLLELYQGTLPHRSSDLADFVADVVGIALSTLLWIAMRKQSPERPSTPASATTRE